jgi:ATP phosphoribosyltransferase regulatory subunit
MQIGAELYGHAGKESDIEIICLMLEMLAMTGLQNVHLDLGHVGIYRALSKQAAFSTEQESALFDILQRKAKPELQELLADYALSDELKALFLQLPELNGDASALTKAQAVFANADAEVQSALAELQAVADVLRLRFPHLPISFDCAELRGYHYHTGIVFAAFVPSVGREIARGGRYDNIGKVFGRARPATGFSADLKVLVSLSKETADATPRTVIFAPDHADAALQEKIRELRAQGQIVIQQLPQQIGNASDLGCTAVLQQNEHAIWLVCSLA